MNRADAQVVHVRTVGSADADGSLLAWLNTSTGRGSQAVSSHSLVEEVHGQVLHLLLWALQQGQATEPRWANLTFQLVGILIQTTAAIQHHA